MKASLTCLLTASLLTSGPARPLELTQIFGPSAVSMERRAAIEWLADGAAYSTLEPSRTIDGSADVVRYETASGKRSIAVRAESLVPAGAATPLAVTNHQWSPNARSLLLTTSAGEHWLFDLETAGLRQLGRGLLHPEFSPDSSRIAYVAGNNLHVDRVASSQVVKLTDDGSDLVLNGRGDVAYEEEFSLGKAFRVEPGFAPHRLLAVRHEWCRHLLHDPQHGWAVLEAVATAISEAGHDEFRSEGGRGFRRFPRHHMVRAQRRRARQLRAARGLGRRQRELLIQYENRLQNTNQVLLGDAETGALRPVMVERDDAWLIPNDEVRWLDGGRAFTWLSERDGWMHLYVVSRDGKRVELRTPGDFDVVSIEAIDDVQATRTSLLRPTIRRSGTCIAHPCAAR